MKTIKLKRYLQTLVSPGIKWECCLCAVILVVLWSCVYTLLESSVNIVWVLLLRLVGFLILCDHSFCLSFALFSL